MLSLAVVKVTTHTQTENSLYVEPFAFVKPTRLRMTTASLLAVLRGDVAMMTIEEYLKSLNRVVELLPSLRKDFEQMTDLELRSEYKDQIQWFKDSLGEWFAYCETAEQRTAIYTAVAVFAHYRVDLDVLGFY